MLAHLKILCVFFILPYVSLFQYPQYSWGFPTLSRLIFSPPSYSLLQNRFCLLHPTLSLIQYCLYPTMSLPPHPKWFLHPTLSGSFIYKYFLIPTMSLFQDVSRFLEASLSGLVFHSFLKITYWELIFVQWNQLRVKDMLKLLICLAPEGKCGRPKCRPWCSLWRAANSRSSCSTGSKAIPMWLLCGGKF